MADQSSMQGGQRIQIVRCPRCQKDIDIEDHNRDESFCGNCFAPLADITERIELNRQEIEKLKWRQKPSS